MFWLPLLWSLVHLSRRCPLRLLTPDRPSGFYQDTPGITNYAILPGSQINGIAVGSDGSTVYVVDTVAGSYILKSTNGGTSFATIMGSGTTAYSGGTPKAVAVAPDNVQAIAVTDGTDVFTSNDSGSTWLMQQRPNTANAAWAGTVVTGIAVAPARPGTLLQREYAVSVANPAAATTTGGDVLIVGGDSAIWTSVAAYTSGFTGTWDFTSLVFTPNYIFDRTLVAVGSNAAGTVVKLLCSSIKSVIGTSNVNGAGTTVAATIDYDASASASASMITSDISLPTNFDPSTAANTRGYVAINSAFGVGSDIYRFDNTATAKPISQYAGTPFRSLSFAGTTTSGTLFIAPAYGRLISYSTDACVGISPDWTRFSKGPRSCNRYQYDCQNCERFHNF